MIQENIITAGILFIDICTYPNICPVIQWSLETWSRSRESSRDLFLRVSVPVSKATGCREILNTAAIQLSKSSVIQRVFVCCIWKEETVKKERKNPRISKRFQLRSGDDIFIRHNPQSFKSRFSVWKLRVSVSRFLMKSRSRRFQFQVHPCREVNLFIVSRIIFRITKSKNGQKMRENRQAHILEVAVTFVWSVL